MLSLCSPWLFLFYEVKIVSSSCSRAAGGMFTWWPLTKILPTEAAPPTRQQLTSRELVFPECLHEMRGAGEGA